MVSFAPSTLQNSTLGSQQDGLRYHTVSFACWVSRKRTPKVHVQTLDLLTVHTLEALEALLRDAVGQLTARFLPRNKRVLGELSKVLTAFKPEVAKLYQRRTVLVIDEFQQIAYIDKQQTIEGAIRHVAQATQALSFVYLGSERLRLGRISAEDYLPFLTEAAKLRWSKTVKRDGLETILRLTDRHPSYANILCRDLWRNSTPSTVEAAQAAWEDVLEQERHQAQRELMSLAHAQRTVLQAIATQPTDQPTAKNYLSRFRIAATTMTRSLEVLVEKDFVRQTHDGFYEVIDPLIQEILGPAMIARHRQAVPKSASNNSRDFWDPSSVNHTDLFLFAGSEM